MSNLKWMGLPVWAASWRRLLWRDHGNVSLIAALAAIPVLALAGVAIDIGHLHRIQSSLQEKVDTAALAAAAASKISTDAAQGKVQRQKIAADYVMASLAGLDEVSLLGDPTIDVGPNDITISLKATVKGPFAGVLSMFRPGDATLKDIGSPNSAGANDRYSIAVSTRAAWSGARNVICMMALNPSSASALAVSGTADIKASNCSIQVNSTSNSALAQSGNATIVAGSICVAGNYSGSNYAPAPKANCATVQDPLAAPFAEDYAAALAAAPVCYTSKSALTFTKGTYTMLPGIYDGGIRVDSGVTLNLQPGIYFVENNALEVRAGGTVNGTGVTLVFTGGPNAILYVIANGNLNLKAPASGYFAGIAIAQHPSVVPSSKYDNTIIGGGAIEIEGIIYFPKQKITITGNGAGTVSNISTNAKQFAIIADTINVQGNGQVNLGQGADFQAAGLPALPGVGSSGGIVRLVD